METDKAKGKRTYVSNENIGYDEQKDQFKMRVQTSDQQEVFPYPLKINPDGTLDVNATLSSGDIEIGAVEIKDASADNRLKVNADGTIDVNMTGGNVGILDSVDTRIDPATEGTLSSLNGKVTKCNTDNISGIVGVKDTGGIQIDPMKDTTGTDILQRLRDDSTLYNTRQSKEFIMTKLTGTIPDGGDKYFVLDTTALDASKQIIVESVLISLDVEGFVYLFVNPSVSGGYTVTPQPLNGATSLGTNVIGINDPTVSSEGSLFYEDHLQGGVSGGSLANTQSFGARTGVLEGWIIPAGVQILIKIHNDSGYTSDHGSIIIRFREEEVS